MFVAQSKNGTFLFDRQYMDYHSNRFNDHSLMVYRSGKLYALLPGNVADETFYSHQGLTFGGLVMNEKATTVDVINVFNLINNSLRSDGLRRVVYKPSPWIFHRQPSEEDLMQSLRYAVQGYVRGNCHQLSRETITTNGITYAKMVQKRQKG